MEQKNFEFNETTYNNMNKDYCSYNCEDMTTQNMMCSPVQECPQERVCHRYMCYEVPHIMPCNTRIINHHIYRHTYKPCYTTCEENVVSNVYDNKCCF
ncbi:MAG: hypothetical protein E7313_06450 [Clostridiales bacterium]|nr:hypothetical protein [Clostridiales bacterium]